MNFTDLESIPLTVESFLQGSWTTRLLLNHLTVHSFFQGSWITRLLPRTESDGPQPEAILSRSPAVTTSTSWCARPSLASSSTQPRCGHAGWSSSRTGGGTWCGRERRLSSVPAPSRHRSCSNCLVLGLATSCTSSRYGGRRSSAFASLAWWLIYRY